MNIFAKYLILFLLLSGCAADNHNDSDAALRVNRIRINQLEKLPGDRPERITTCAGFILAENHVRDFLLYSTLVETSDDSRYYDMLPCSRSGTLRMNGTKYAWVIRSGGVGIFTSGKERIIKVCGKNCCSKIPAVC